MKLNYQVILLQDEMTDAEMDQVLNLMRKEERTDLIKEVQKEELLENVLSKLTKQEAEYFKPVKRIMWRKENGKTILYDNDLVAVSTVSELPNKVKQTFLNTYLREKYEQFKLTNNLKRVIDTNHFSINYVDYFQYSFPNHTIVGYMGNELVVNFK